MRCPVPVKPVVVLLNVDVAGQQALGCLWGQRELKLEIAKKMEATTDTGEGPGEFGPIRWLRGQNALDNAALYLLNEALAPAGIHPLRTAWNKAFAGRVGHQVIEAAIERHRHVLIIRQIVHPGELDHPAVVGIAVHEQVGKVVKGAVGATVNGNAANSAMQLIIDALLALGAEKVFSAGLAIQVHAVSGSALRIVEGEGILIGRCAVEPL